MGHNNSYVSKAVDATYYGLVQSRRCEFDEKGVLNCQLPLEPIRSERYLKVCQREQAYPRNSIESVAMTAAVQIDRAWDFYHQLEHRKSLARVKLLIHPFYEKEIYNNKGNFVKRTTMKDNLTYSYSSKKFPIFTIYPSGAFQDINSGISGYLWESPWAMAHEFGHHVFKTHTGLQHFSPTSLMASNHDSKQASLMKRNEWTGSFQKKDFEAVNEAFSDMFAHYVIAGSGDYTKGFPCLETSRYLLSKTFKDGAVKKLTRPSLMNFYSLEEKSISNHCQTTDFSRSHTMAAVIARGMHQIFSLSYQDPPDRRKLASKLLNWADRIKHLIQKDPGRVTLGRLLEEGIQVVTRGTQQNQLNLRQCQAIQEYFPAFSNVWIGKRYHCENNS